MRVGQTAVLRTKHCVLLTEHRYIELFLNSVPGNRSDGMYQGDGDFDGDEDMDMFGAMKGNMMRKGMFGCLKFSVLQKQAGIKKKKADEAMMPV